MMKFWDREKEKEWLKRYLKSEPNAILFVYGPKSSGKSTLLQKVAQEVDGKINFYWYDLRGKVVSSYRDVLGVFFKEKGWKEKVLESIGKILKFNIYTFELDGEELTKVLRKEYDAFEIMENQLSKDMEKGSKPVIVFDELQKLKDVYMNGNGDGQKPQRPLVKELFNFFVRLTKVLHLSHVIVMSSDTFFIEEVYADSTLKNCSRYYLVDFFDDETAYNILVNEGIDEKDAKEIVEKAGGVPWILEEVLESDQPLQVLEDLKTQAKSDLREKLAELSKKSLKVYEDAREFLITLLNKEEIEYIGRNREKLELLVQMEILFYDPLKGKARFQTKLDELAAREILKEQRR